MVKKTQEWARGLESLFHKEAAKRYPGTKTWQEAKIIERGYPKRDPRGKYREAAWKVFGLGYVPGGKGLKRPSHLLPRPPRYNGGPITGPGPGPGGKPCMGATILISATSLILSVLMLL